jgi:hypothetical protein
MSNFELTFVMIWFDKNGLLFLVFYLFWFKSVWFSLTELCTLDTYAPQMSNFKFKFVMKLIGFLKLG